MKRSHNILEFQVGKNSSNKNDFDTLCMDNNFQEDGWITQASKLKTKRKVYT